MEVLHQLPKKLINIFSFQYKKAIDKVMAFLYTIIFRYYFNVIGVCLIFSCISCRQGTSNYVVINYQGWVLIPISRTAYVEKPSVPTNNQKNIDKLVSIGGEYLRLGKHQQFKRVCEQLLQIARKRGDDTLKARTLKGLAYYYQNIKHYDSAYSYFIKSEKLYRKLRLYNNVAELCNNRAYILIAIKDFTSAEMAAIEAMKAARNKNTSVLFTSYALMGVTSSKLQDYDKALEYHKKALNVLDKYTVELEDHNRVVTLNNIGNVYQDLGNYGLATDYYQQALANTAITKSTPALHAKLLDNLGYTIYKGGATDHAYNLIKRSLAIRDSINSEEQVYSKIHLAEVHLNDGESYRAIMYYKEALITSAQHKMYDDVLLCLHQLAVVDRKQATAYLTHYGKLSDSLRLAERNLRNHFARIQFETDEITQDKNIAIKQKWISLAAASTLLLITMLLFIIRLQRSKQKEYYLIQEQQRANEEIYSLMLQQQSKIDEGRQKEKLRIARDLHDGVMNRLTSTRMNLFVLNKNKDTETVEKCLPYIRSIQDIEKEIRQIAHDLNNEVFDEQGSFRSLVETLLEEQKSISAAYYHIEVDREIGWERFKGGKKVHIYRILQESFQNINKHAKAQNVVISILDKMGHVAIEISDDGIGFYANKGKDGIGLANIRARVNALGGNIEIITSNRGTKINLLIPN